jgi:hypothetical protein
MESARDGDFVEARVWVVRQNLKRRHLTTSQRGLVAARLTTVTGPGQPEKIVAMNSVKLPNILKRSTEDVAQLFNVSPKTVTDLRTVSDYGDEKTIAAVQSGAVSVSKAAKDIRKNTPAFKKPPAPRRPSHKKSRSPGETSG